MQKTKYYLLIENGKSCEKGFIQINLESALKNKQKLEKEHEPRKWFIVEVETTGKGFTAY